MKILDGINHIKDIKNLSVKQLEELCAEIREEIISVVKQNGGHLSANLGIVELTIALYYTFDFPTDKLIFDVGHQCYAHKILSGRRKDFSSIRTKGGLSGFPDREESEFDAFTTGHAGNSIAVSLGYATARNSLKENYFVVNVVGDGSFSNGLNLEALTSSEYKPNKYITVFNDNGMSISKNKNGLYRVLSKTTAKKAYRKNKRAIKKVFGNSFITRGLARFRDFIKRVLNKKNYIEQFGYKYVGIEDGNDLKGLIKTLSIIKETSLDRAIFLHVKTTKGKGLGVAEERADVYHGVGKDMASKTGTFSNALGKTLCSIIEKDKKVIAITAAMKDGTGLSVVKEKFPDNFIDVGIAEEYAVTMAGGIASGGAKPVVAIYSTFMQRAYDQILSDVCMQNLPVVFCLDRSGLVGEDGKTHQGVFDLSFLSHLPNITVLAPSCVAELEKALEYALTLSSPVAIRYPKSGPNKREYVSAYKPDKWNVLKEGKGDVVILAVGPNCCDLALEYAKDKDITVVSCGVIKPLDTKTLNKYRSKTIITIEENSAIGGFGSLVCAYFSGDNATTVKVMGVKDEFIKHASIKEQFKEAGLTIENLSELIEKREIS
jgi:1-deoxy-D-xylulose-5-phosphate synthase